MLIVAPPSGPAKKATSICASPAVTPVIVGAEEYVAGTAVTVSVDPVPAPAALTARSDTVYDVPFVNPVMITGDRVSAGLSAVQVLPESVEYS